MKLSSEIARTNIFSFFSFSSCKPIKIKINYEKQKFLRHKLLDAPELRKIDLFFPH